MEIEKSISKLIEAIIEKEPTFAFSVDVHDKKKYDFGGVSINSSFQCCNCNSEHNDIWLYKISIIQENEGRSDGKYIWANKSYEIKFLNETIGTFKTNNIGVVVEIGYMRKGEWRIDLAERVLSGTYRMRVEDDNIYNFNDIFVIDRRLMLRSIHKLRTVSYPLKSNGIRKKRKSWFL